MGAFGTGAFYSMPHPENIGSPGPEEQQQPEYQNPNPAQQPGAEAPKQARPIVPPYIRNWENSAASFAPDAPTQDPSMQPDLQPANVGPSMGSLPLIAAGIFLLWVFTKGDQS